MENRKSFFYSKCFVNCDHSHIYLFPLRGPGATAGVPPFLTIILGAPRKKIGLRIMLCVFLFHLSKHSYSLKLCKRATFPFNSFFLTWDGFHQCREEWRSLRRMSELIHRSRFCPPWDTGRDPRVSRRRGCCHQRRCQASRRQGSC